MKEDQLETFYPKGRKDWRDWLTKYHDKKESVWLIYDKKTANHQRVNWAETVEEALCFGWIDSRSKPIDDEKYMQFFSKRKANSTWSKINKEKVAMFIAQGIMAPAGLKCIETAKRNGSWEILDSVEALVIPADLQAVFDQEPDLASFFDSLSKSRKKQILLWLVVARKAETRTKRIIELTKSFSDRLLPPQFRS